MVGLVVLLDEWDGGEEAIGDWGYGGIGWGVFELK